MKGQGTNHHKELFYLFICCDQIRSNPKNIPNIFGSWCTKFNKINAWHNPRFLSNYLNCLPKINYKLKCALHFLKLKYTEIQDFVVVAEGIPCLGLNALTSSW